MGDVVIAKLRSILVFGFCVLGSTVSIANFHYDSSCNDTSKYCGVINKTTESNLLSDRQKAQLETWSLAMNESVMSEDRFWELIDLSSEYEADPARQLEVLKQALLDLSPAELEAFERAFQREQLRAYTWKLWGAAYVINGGASDDGFEYFQRWLISKGREIFNAAVSDPDSLADILADDTQGPCEFEEFVYVASSVWQEKTGINPWQDSKGRFPYTGAPPANNPSGTPFKEDENFLAKQYPKLWARFGKSPLG
jgi:hypothetical protein